MKTFAVLFSTLVAAIVLNSCLNSLLVAFHYTAQMAPAYAGVAASDPKPAAANSNREDASYNIGDFWIDNRAPARTSNYAERVVDDKSQTQIEYPTGW